ncbi:MAG: tetratricopeptide repeat protein [Aureispira sp.]
MKYASLSSLFLLIHLTVYGQSSQQYKDSLQMETLRKEGLYAIEQTIAERKAAFEKAEAIAIKYQYTKRQFFILGDAGDFYEKLDEHDKAIALYKKAIHIKETNKLRIWKGTYARWHNALSGTLQDQSGKATNDKQTILEEALLHSRIATHLNANKANFWLLLGNAHIRLAEVKLEPLEDKTELNSALRTEIAEEALAHYRRAVVAYKKVEKLRPTHPDIEQNMSVAYRETGKVLGKYLGQLDESIVSLENAIFYKKDINSYRLLGVATGIKAVQLDPEGKKEESKAMHQKAIQYFEKALEIDPEAIAVLYNLQMAHHFLGNMDQAALYREKWQAINPNYNPKGTN